MDTTRDMFGTELISGDIVVHADTRIGSDEIVLGLYEIMEIVDGVVFGVLMNTEYMGNVFYLVSPETRCARIRNVYKSSELFGNTLLS